MSRALIRTQDRNRTIEEMMEGKGEEDETVEGELMEIYPSTKQLFDVLVSLSVMQNQIEVMKLITRQNRGSQLS